MLVNYGLAVGFFLKWHMGIHPVIRSRGCMIGGLRHYAVEIGGNFFPYGLCHSLSIPEMVMGMH